MLVMILFLGKANELQRRCQTVENGISDSGNTCQASPHDLCLGIADWGTAALRMSGCKLRAKNKQFFCFQKG